MLLLEFLADLVLEEDIGRGGTLWGVGILGFGVALALLGSVWVLWGGGGSALAF